MAIDTDQRLRGPHPIYRTELEQAAFNHGYRRPKGTADGWLFFGSAEDVPGEVAMANGRAQDGSPWLLAVEHAGVAAQMRSEFAEALAAPPPVGFQAAFAFPTQPPMRAALSRAWNLARSLPSFPLSQYMAEVASLGDTEAERLAKVRIGQGIFRRALEEYWGNRCPLTGIREPALLRASHIVGWALCRSDAERLDVHNGLLLAVHWDAAFDKGLVSFGDDGRALVKSDLDPAVLALLAPDTAPTLSLTDAHRVQLAWHRAQFGFGLAPTASSPPSPPPHSPLR